MMSSHDPLGRDRAGLRGVLCRVRRDQRGFTMVEAMMAGMILVIGVFAIAGAMTFGLSSTGLARQRTAAQTLAEQQMELARTLDYDQLLLYYDASDSTTYVQHSADPENPDFWVSDGPPVTYDSDGSGSAPAEPLVQGNQQPSLIHYQTNLVQGNTSFTVYTYVTWVDSPADGTGALDLADGNGDGVAEGTHDDKRVTVVVVYSKLTGGQSYQLKMSSIFSDGLIPYKGSDLTGGVNQPPSVQCPLPTQASPNAGSVSSLTVSFSAVASDPDGSVAQVAWDFGDGTIVSDGGVAQTHTYAAAGTYTVTNTVFDDASPPASASNAAKVCRVSVSPPPDSGDDQTPPSGTIVIASGSTYTTSTQVTLSLSATDNVGVETMQFASVDASSSCTNYGAPITYATSTLYTIPAPDPPAGDGNWKVCVRFADAAGNVSAAASDTIWLDRAAPPAPGNLSVARAASRKSATLQWTEPVAKPGDFAGYQVWRKATTSTTWDQVSCSYAYGVANKCDDNDLDNKTNYEYYVVSLDFAGNQSAQSNHVTV